jgi:hypothetical protein
MRKYQGPNLSIDLMIIGAFAWLLNLLFRRA